MCNDIFIKLSKNLTSNLHKTAINIICTHIPINVGNFPNLVNDMAFDSKNHLLIQNMLIMGSDRSDFFFHLGFTVHQDYFTNFELSQSLGGAKKGDPERNHQTTSKQNLAFLTGDPC